MNTLRNTGLILSLALVFSLPINASAAEVIAPAASTEQPAAQSMPSMQDMMRQMRRDPSSMPGPMPGMGMGPGKGGMNNENCRMGGGMQGQGKPCMQAQYKNCNMNGGMDDQRLDMLEKRMDMMQMMLEMMLRSGSRN